MIRYCKICLSEINLISDKGYVSCFHCGSYERSVHIENIWFDPKVSSYWLSFNNKLKIIRIYKDSDIIVTINNVEELTHEIALKYFNKFKTYNLFS